MKRLLLILAAAPLAGCGVECGNPSQIDGQYTVFMNFTSKRLDETRAPSGFPTFASPGNGWGEWELDWHSSGDVVDVLIDGQLFQARGDWDPVQCGRFRIDLADTYEYPYTFEDGVTDETIHEFDATLDLLIYGTKLEGTFRWDEVWTNFQDETGTLSGRGIVAGTRTPRSN